MRFDRSLHSRDIAQLKQAIDAPPVCIIQEFSDIPHRSKLHAFRSVGETLLGMLGSLKGKYHTIKVGSQNSRVIEASGHGHGLLRVSHCLLLRARVP
jgi:hypothetical protein